MSDRGLLSDRHVKGSSRTPRERLTPEPGAVRDAVPVAGSGRAGARKKDGKSSSQVEANNPLVQGHSYASCLEKSSRNSTRQAELGTLLPDMPATRLRRCVSPSRKLLLAGIAFTILFLGAEFSLRLVVWAKGGLPPTPDDSQIYEWKWGRHHLDSGSIETNGLYDFHPVLGWRLRPNLRLEQIRSNADGLRAERDYSSGRRSKGKRLMLLGDSFTFGAFVDNQETYAHVLESEELPPGCEVLNLGNDGYGPGQTLLNYEIFGLPYQPEVVAICFYVRDYERSTLSFKSYQKPVFTVAGEGLRLLPQTLIPPQELYDQFESGERPIGVGWTRSFVVMKVARAMTRLQRKQIGPEDTEWQILSRVMRRFRDRAQAAGSAPVWVVIPHRDVIEGPSRWQAIEDLCEQEAATLDLPCLRLDEVFRAHSRAEPEQPIYRPRHLGGHLSVTGNRVVARALASFLREQRLLGTE